jgi:phosphate transport system substrate-binding protein
VLAFKLDNGRHSVVNWGFFVYRVREWFFALLMVLPLMGCSDPNSTTLQGAGATFPAPLYKRWFLEYHLLHPEVRTNYQAIGSGAGIRQITAGLVDFAASDAAMTDKELADVSRPVLMLPMTAGNIALAYNLPKADQPLRLSRKTMIDIFLGKITVWNDAALIKDNPGLTLPDWPIVVVCRAESSGTTFAFSNHLAAISPEWKKDVGASKTVDKWKVGIKTRGNSGVAATIQQTPGAIGYIEAGYAELAHLPMAAIENQSGQFQVPSPKAGQAALANVQLPENLRVFVTDPKGNEAYPIVTMTWMLVFKNYPDAKTAETIKALLRYGLNEGQQTSDSLGYIPLPKSVVEKVLKAVDQIGVEK